MIAFMLVGIGTTVAVVVSKRSPPPVVATTQPTAKPADPAPTPITAPAADAKAAADKPAADAAKDEKGDDADKPEKKKKAHSSKPKVEKTAKADKGGQAGGAASEEEVRHEPEGHRQAARYLTPSSPALLRAIPAPCPAGLLPRRFATPANSDFRRASARVHCWGGGA
jgi:hypothetical protein